MTAAELKENGVTPSTKTKNMTLSKHMPKIAMTPAFIIAVVYILGFVLWSGWLSLTNSRMLPRYDFAGFVQYEKLFENERWWVASSNLLIFGGLFIFTCMILGLLLAILLDQNVKGEGVFRTIYLYPMALSFVVTGTIWRWLLNPSLGLEKLMHELGFEGFVFDWLVDPDMAIYTVVIAGVWQSTGFAMTLFLAGLRGVDSSIIEAARIDGAGLVKTYYHVIIPGLKPVFFSTFIILAHIAIKSFDLVMALTRGGPGYSTDLPATFMYTYTFTRGRIGLGSASAMVMLFMIFAVIGPYLYFQLKGSDNE